MHLSIDALLLLSFGGPEKSEDVMPFLRNVTRGRGIPDERLEVVATHYHHFDGYSPLNDCNREIVANIQSELSHRGRKLPVYFGNRNWHPFAVDTSEEIARDGHKTVAVFATSAWGGYSGCRQYNEDISALREHLAERSLPSVDFIKLRQFYDHPEFIAANAHAVRDTLAKFQALNIPPSDLRLVFTAHSIPMVADENSGTFADGNLYSRQIHEAARLVAHAVDFKDYDVVWQSASGDGRIPWLEPDIRDHVEQLNDQGVNNILVCPIGFISDHMEVVWDLDNEVRDDAQRLNMTILRAPTVGHTQKFASMVVDLIDESLGKCPAQHSGTVISKGVTLNGAACEYQCCPPARRPHSTKE
ncbi:MULTISPECIES: ferrochelatase [unclassified Corynebacterium]|uniref:ferrochelatase n=1 Tax=unclassified Corynebacterium TaxID=2624378 RepID=UPI0021670186|nr:MULTISPECIES: ferrochelatase [unclassified Corynebacterium]MCS4489314.1 ferrochelatase [Corynebacterium sp. ES2775-CONJ]MCS4491127.1 ferrochelatase [Corynebacterium sp. ES2715-CONJ3]